MRNNHINRANSLKKFKKSIKIFLDPDGVGAVRDKANSV